MNNIEFISAGAGSGKTYKLTVILADALESGAARPNAILATTFTVRAATELRERARSWLLGKGRIDLATAVGQARLGTVNSVCGQMLKRFCFELGLSPDQTVLSEGQTKRLLASSLSETLDGPGQVELVQLTTRFGIEQSEWSKFIESVVKAARDNDIAPSDLRAMGLRNADLMLANWPAPSAGPDPTVTLAAALSQALAAVSNYIQEAVAKGTAVAKNLQSGQQDLQRLERAFREGHWTWPDWIAAHGGDAGAKVKDHLLPVKVAAQAHEAHPTFHAEVRRYLDLVFNLAADALDTYAQAKLALGAVDFSDQEVLLLRAVRESPEVREALAGELDLILVDEFQDTSPLQLALFVELAKLAKRSVWVGDPKQAIYGFRGTDARLIAGVLGAIKTWGGTLGEPLTTSRRSTPGLASLTNAVFQSAFLPELAPDDVRLQPSRTDIDGQAALFNWNFESKNNEADYLGLGQAVGEFIRSGYSVEDKASKQRRPVRPGDIAVLCRMNSKLSPQADLAVASLTNWGIPCASPRAGLMGTPEVAFVLACLRRVLDAGDTVATALILTLADGVPVEAWLLDRLQFLAAEGAIAHQWKTVGESAHPLLSRLETLRSHLAALTPYEAVRLAASESHVARVASQWSKSAHEARTRIANIEELVKLSQAYEDECVSAKRPATVTGLLRWLEALAKSGDDNRATTSDDAVSVMTHHGAKGLEWPVVILTSLGTTARSALWEVRARTDGAFDPQVPLNNRFIHFWLKTWGKRTQPQAALNAEASDIGKAMQADAMSENKRLLYVSMTRARDANVLVSCVRNGKEPNRAWVGELNGATELLFGDSGTMNLPDGRQLLRQSRTWTGDECALQPPETPTTACSWFLSRAPMNNLPLWYRPSAAVGGAYAVTLSEAVGVRIALTSKVDMATLGIALHLTIARAGTLGTVDPSEVEHILQTWGVAHAFDKAAVQAQVEALYAWIRARWPDCRILVEVPMEVQRANGTRLRGRIDLLVDTPDGWILFDHKSNPSGASADERLAHEHGPQLAAYADALLRATGRPVKEHWLYMPVAARALQLITVA